MHRFALALAGFVVLLSGAGCKFDSSRLDDRRCTDKSECAPDEVCCLGSCVLAGSCGDMGSDFIPPPADLGPDFDPSVDRDLDGVLDDADNCPDVWNPGQQDGDGDGDGDHCDCAASDPVFADAVIDVPAFAAPSPFTAIDQPTAWSVIGNVLRQQNQNGVRRASHSLLPHRAFRATVTLRFNKAGTDELDEPAENVSMAGIVVRTSDLSVGAGAGYYCAIDLANFRLVIGKTVDDDLADNKMRLFADPFAPPGQQVPRVFVDTSYKLTMRAVGNQLRCTVVRQNTFQVETQAVDDALSNGSVALFTAGASANFETVKVCANK